MSVWFEERGDFVLWRVDEVVGAPFVFVFQRLVGPSELQRLISVHYNLTIDKRISLPWRIYIPVERRQ